MKTDRELLELAAKAAGLPLLQWAGKGMWMGEPDAEGFQLTAPDFDRWNPLTNDGDALRLAVKLGMMVDTVNRVVAGYTSSITIEIGFDDLGNDPCAANRRAIVLAAAAEGEAV